MLSLRTNITPILACSLLCLSSCKKDNVVVAQSADSGEIEVFEETVSTNNSSSELKQTLDASKKTTQGKKSSEEESEKAVFNKVVNSKKDIKKSAPTKKTKPKKKKPAKKKRKALISFEEPFKDFGEIIEGDTVNFKFNFTNTGNAPLEILSAVPTCGCTRPSTPFLAIEPGEDGYIGVKFISIDKLGEQTPTITVTSNAHPKTVVLTMSGFVKERPKKEEKKKAEKEDLLEMVKDSIVKDSIGN